MLKKIFLINLIFLVYCFSHQKETSKLNISIIDEKNIKIEILESKTNKEKFLNQIKIISIKDNQVLMEFLLSKDNQIITIPPENFYIIAKIGDNLLYNRYSNYKNFFIFFCSFVFFISLVIYSQKVKKLNNN